MLQKIRLSSSHRKILSEYSENQKPNESCAILFGKKSQVSEIFRTENIEKNSLVSEIFLTENIAQSPVNFTISDEQLIKTYKIAEERGMDMVGIFHSHPDSDAYPSSTDKKFMDINPVVWVIYSGVGKNFRAYVLESDTIIEIPIEW